jgi:hypothetical protein
MQKPELQQNEEQADDDGTSGIQEILPVLPQAPAASGDEVNRSPADAG